MSIKEECFLGRTGVGSVSPASPEREKAVAEITPCYAESRQQDIGPDRIHSGEFHEQNHPRRADQGGTAVDGPAFEVFAQIVAARPEDDPFVAEESVGHGEDLDRDADEEIVFLSSPQPVQKCEEPHPEERIPAADDEIADDAPHFRISIQL